MRAGTVEGERASSNENLYAWSHWISAICEATTARTTTCHCGWHSARCLLSLGLCGAFSGKFDALCHGCGIPCALVPLGIAYRNGCPAFVCDCEPLPRSVGCALYTGD